jgi:hypothetical protein
MINPITGRSVARKGSWAILLREEVFQTIELCGASSIKNRSTGQKTIKNKEPRVVTFIFELSFPLCLNNMEATQNF